jgi:hypothetical protein
MAYAFIYFEKDAAAVMACQYPVSHQLHSTQKIRTDTFLPQLIFIRENHRARVQPKRSKYMRRIAQPQIHNIVRDASGDTLFFSPLPQYTYRPGHSSCTPRSMRSNWPRY